MKFSGYAATICGAAIAALLTIPFATAHEGHSHGSSKKLSRHDQLKAAAQKICPVSGKKLGSMGTPVKVRIGDEELFLCCQGCADGEVRREHWAAIHANFARAQGECPVMENPLPKKPKWTVVNGQISYVCCPPCTKKIQADPET